MSRRVSILRFLGKSRHQSARPADRQRAGSGQVRQIDPSWSAEPAPLVLLAGPPRSGTTWLNREICDRPGWVGFLPECTLLTQQVALYSRTKHYGEAKRFAAYFGAVENMAAIYRGIMAQMIGLAGQLNRTADADVLVLKDPELSLYLEDLADILPPHRLICLVRDPRDVIASVRKVTERKGEAWDVAKACDWIFPYYAGIQQHRDAGRSDSLFVRYEDLVAGQIGQVRAYLGQPAEADPFARAPGEIASRLDSSDPFFSAHYLKPTTQDLVGSYARILTAPEIAHVQRAFSGVMAAWGYL